VRPIGAQLSTRAVAFLGANFVCAHAGDEINSIANTSFFIGFFHEGSAGRSLLNRIGRGMSIAVIWLRGERKPPSQQVRFRCEKPVRREAKVPIGLCGALEKP
jgi:hypothetical protein